MTGSREGRPEGLGYTFLLGFGVTSGSGGVGNRKRADMLNLSFLKVTLAIVTM